MSDREVLFGAAVIGVGVAFVGGGVAVLSDRWVLRPEISALHRNAQVTQEIEPV